MRTPAEASASARPLVFDVRGITKVYHMGEVDVHALRGVDLQVPAGDLTVLLGPSGSGKSTLVNILGGLDSPTAGTVRYRVQDLTHASEGELTTFRRSAVGFVFQFYNLMPSLTALENVELATDLAPDPMPAADALALVDLAPRQDHFPAQLSGGEQQRVAIARAIAKRPDVLLCDEPTGALDLATGMTVLAAIVRVNMEIGTTTLLITHNSAIAGLADRVVTMSDGRIATDHRNAQRQSVHEVRW
jgi:putative ABC transport system ATP-binding protein